MYLTKNLNPNYIFKNLLHHLLVHNKLAPINQFEACIYAHTFCGSEVQAQLSWVNCLQVFMKLQSRRQPGLRCHLKACWGRSESAGIREATVLCSLIVEVIAHHPAMFYEKQATRSSSHSRGRRTRVFPTVPETLSTMSCYLYSFLRVSCFHS